MRKRVRHASGTQIFFVETLDTSDQFLVAEVARAEGASSVVPDLRGVTFVCGRGLARRIVRKAGKLSPILDGLCLRALTHVLEAHGYSPSNWVTSALSGTLEEKSVRHFLLQEHTDSLCASEQ
jgi:hypothetical protein